MTRADIPYCMELKRAANWNQLEQDWEMLLDVGEYQMVAEYQGVPVGSVTSINYSGRFSWIGMILVDPSQRRSGIGTELLKSAIDSTRGNGTIRLDATPKGKILYDSLGFRVEYSLSRHQLISLNHEFPSPELICHRVTEEDIDFIADFDQDIFGANRKTILNHLFNMSPSYAWILQHEGQVVGYCLGRPGSNFEQIGPVVANDELAARSLLINALGECKNKSVIIDSLDDQHEWNSFLKEIGFEVQRPLIRMYLGEHLHPGKPEYQYAIAGPEVG